METSFRNVVIDVCKHAKDAVAGAAMLFRVGVTALSTALPAVAAVSPAATIATVAVGSFAATEAASIVDAHADVMFTWDPGTPAAAIDQNTFGEAITADFVGNGNLSDEVSNWVVTFDGNNYKFSEPAGFAAVGYVPSASTPDLNFLGDQFMTLSSNLNEIFDSPSSVDLDVVGADASRAVSPGGIDPGFAVYTPPQNDNNAVPEPTSLALLCAGLGLLGLRTWRNDRASA